MLDRRQALTHLTSGMVVAASSLPLSVQAQAAPVLPIPIQFESNGATFGADLHLPATPPVGGIVIVHGAGRVANYSNGLANLFTPTGLAVLAYDKRGLGRSGGTYEETNNTSPGNLALLAADAAAALHTLRHRPELAGRKIGYWGVSQAGWVIPLALAASGGADFFVLWSGPVCTVAEEIEDGIGSGGNLSDDRTARMLVQRMRTQHGDTDPRTSLRQVAVPGLWIFGGRDETHPVKLSVARLQGLIDEGKNNFAYWLNSAGHHFDLQNCQPFLAAMMRWMEEQTAPT